MFTVLPNYSTSDSSYNFCGACAVSIDANYKIYHTSTKEHADAVKHDELLSNLFDIYKNKSKLSKIDTTISTVHVLVNNKNNNTTEVNSRNQVKKVSPHNKVPAITMTSEDEELSVLQQHINYINYTNHMNQLKSQSYLYILENKYLHVVIDFFFYQVHIRNFNGITRNYNVNWRCLLCDIMLNKEADIVVHCQNMNHIKYITGPIYNAQCIRKFARYPQVQTNIESFHCIVCNILISGEVAMVNHVDNNLHKLAVNRSLIYTKNPKTGIITCCACMENLTDPYLPNHEYREMHLRNLKIRRQTSM
ncbi:uncharacterized protein LOC131849004 [Achroia grisella]|uniref:uncharacterized protein LOC131849004 n=1 Tax=Achroia grisella TaxID=688607 RepID=UPI0027D2EC5C|nr:uncharacterized protein LOC131849004 [Achroia grisella]